MSHIQPKQYRAVPCPCTVPLVIFPIPQSTYKYNRRSAIVFKFQNSLCLKLYVLFNNLFYKPSFCKQFFNGGKYIFYIFKQLRIRIKYIINISYFNRFIKHYFTILAQLITLIFLYLFIHYWRWLSFSSMI